METISESRHVRFSQDTIGTHDASLLSMMTLSSTGTTTAQQPQQKQQVLVLQQDENDKEVFPSQQSKNDDGDKIHENQNNSSSSFCCSFDENNNTTQRRKQQQQQQQDDNEQESSSYQKSQNEDGNHDNNNNNQKNSFSSFCCDENNNTNHQYNRLYCTDKDKNKDKNISSNKTVKNTTAIDNNDDNNDQESKIVSQRGENDNNGKDSGQRHGDKKEDEEEKQTCTDEMDGLTFLSHQNSKSSNKTNSKKAITTTTTNQEKENAVTSAASVGGGGVGSRRHKRRIMDLNATTTTTNETVGRQKKPFNALTATTTASHATVPVRVATAVENNHSVTTFNATTTTKITTATTKSVKIGDTTTSLLASQDAGHHQMIQDELLFLFDSIQSFMLKNVVTRSVVVDQNDQNSTNNNNNGCHDWLHAVRSTMELAKLVSEDSNRKSLLLSDDKQQLQQQQQQPGSNVGGGAGNDDDDTDSSSLWQKLLNLIAYCKTILEQEGDAQGDDNNNDDCDSTTCVSSVTGCSVSVTGGSLSFIPPSASPHVRQALLVVHLKRHFLDAMSMMLHFVSIDCTLSSSSNNAGSTTVTAATAARRLACRTRLYLLNHKRVLQGILYLILADARLAEWRFEGIVRKQQQQQRPTRTPPHRLKEAADHTPKNDNVAIPVATTTGMTPRIAALQKRTFLSLLPRSLQQQKQQQQNVLPAKGASVVGCSSSVPPLQELTTLNNNTSSKDLSLSQESEVDHIMEDEFVPALSQESKLSECTGLSLLVSSSVAADSTHHSSSVSTSSSMQQTLNPTAVGRQKRKKRRMEQQQQTTGGEASAGEQTKTTLESIPENTKPLNLDTATRITSTAPITLARPASADKDGLSFRMENGNGTLPAADDSAIRAMETSVNKLGQELDVVTLRVMKTTPTLSSSSAATANASTAHSCGSELDDLTINIPLLALSRIVAGKLEGTEEACFDVTVDRRNHGSNNNENDYNDEDEEEEETNPLFVTNRLVGSSGIVPLLSHALADTLATGTKKLLPSSKKKKKKKQQTICKGCLAWLHRRVQLLVSIVDGAALLNETNREHFAQEGYNSHLGGPLIVGLVGTLQKLLRAEKLLDGVWGEISLEVLRTITSLTHENRVAAKEIDKSSLEYDEHCKVPCLRVLARVLFYCANQNVSKCAEKLKYDCVILCLNSLANIVESGARQKRFAKLTVPVSVVECMDINNNSDDGDQKEQPFLRWLVQWLVAETSSFRDAVTDVTSATTMTTTRQSERRLSCHEDEKLVTSGNGFVLLSCLLIGDNCNSCEQQQQQQDGDECVETKLIHEMILEELPGDDRKSKIGMMINTMRAFCNFYHLSLGELSVAVVTPVKILIAKLEQTAMLVQQQQ